MSLPATLSTWKASLEAYTRNTQGTRCILAVILPALAEQAIGELLRQELSVPDFQTVSEPVLELKFPGTGPALSGGCMQRVCAFRFADATIEAQETQEVVR